MFIVDFETDAIAPRPEYPPRPVGVAVHNPAQPHAFYAAWGHPTGNNCTWEQGKRGLEAIWDQPLCFHNGAFDIAVAMKHFGLPWPKEWHDTLFLNYLTRPHATSLSLKPSVEELLGIKPTERDAVKDWVLGHIQCKPKEWGAHIGKAPGELVGPYSAADTLMTRALFDYLMPKVEAAGMFTPYWRERTLCPLLLEAEERGVRVDVEKLGEDTEFYGLLLRDLDDKIRQELGALNLNIDSNDELADALEAKGLVNQWVATPTGKRSTSAKNMAVALKGSPLAALLRYRGALATCHGTFMAPWLKLSQAKGRIFPTWNQVRGDEGMGTRTGRLSCANPNLMNVPKEFDGLVIPEDYPALPLMRTYLLPEEGEVWCRRDYAQQELRILAHYEDGPMMEQYQKDPTVDFHDLAGELIKANTGRQLTRKHIKTTAFSILYGAGAATMAERLNCSPAEAQELKDAYYEAIPGIRKLQWELKHRARTGQPMRTWGGRLYYCETAPDGRDLSYKLLNYLIQGSAADCTKQAVINYHNIMRYGKFLVQVHDELNISVPEECREQEMKLLAEAMADVPFDVPMLSDGSVGPNYGEQEDAA